MAEFYSLWVSRDAVVTELETLARDAEENKDNEKESATRIQKLYRGQRVRTWITEKRNAAGEIQRIFRGYLGRNRAAAELQGKMRHERMAVYHYHSVFIQKNFRGFYSRRYFHDFFARKAYIQSIMAKSNALRDKLEANLRMQQDEEEIQRNNEAHAEFTKVTQNLHHLLSTQVTPGIYNSPYLMPEQLPTAFNLPVELHLRNGVKDLLKARQTKRKGTVKKPPALGFDNRASVQAASKYSVVEDATKMEGKYSKALRVDQSDFFAGGKARDLGRYAPSVDQGTQYLDKWRNPYATRGVPTSEMDVDPRTTTLGKAPAEPFYLAVGGNKNTVLANDQDRKSVV